MTSEHREATYDELDALVRARQKLKRLAVQDKISSLLRAGSKTVFRFLLRDLEFWSIQTAYILLRYYARQHGLRAYPSMTPISSVGGLSAFIVVRFAPRQRDLRFAC